MGMFDTIWVNSKRLPLSSEEQEALSNQFFQTKSLEKLLIYYRITDEGDLEYLDKLADSEEEAQPKKSGKWVKIQDIHGYITFYTSLDKEWFEFVAKFTDGKLVTIFRNTNKRYHGNRSALN
ncbi:MAG: hypothetical protein EAZ32_04760 [Cytophagia bacterium]|jgi:hypothetical protein|nr:MAG: hypothetical protein EAZ32_04760 [Cytophagia bacterium]